MQPCKRHLTAILLPSAAFTDAPLSSHRENLSKDLYLISQMDSDQFVPIWTIASMEGIKVLTTDTDLILDVLRCTCLHFTSMVHFFLIQSTKMYIALNAHSISNGPSWWKRGKGASKSQEMHHHSARSPWNYTCWGEKYYQEVEAVAILGILFCLCVCLLFSSGSGSLV